MVDASPPGPAGFQRNAEEAPKSRRRYFRLPTVSIKTYLFLVMLAAALPIALLMSYEVYVQSHANREQLLDKLVRAASTGAQNVNREIQSSLDALTILSYRIDIQNGDLHGFIAWTQAQPLLRPSWSSVYLKDRSGRILLDSAPSARELPSDLPEAEGQTNDPWSVSNLKADENGRLVTEIEVPVSLDGERRFTLGARVPVSFWQQLMTDSALPPPARTAVIDRNSRLVARSHMSGQFVGKKIDEATGKLLGERPSGSATTVSIEKNTSMSAWETVPLSRWIVAVGIPTKAFNETHVKSVATALFTAISCLILGFVAAFLVARKMILPLRRLAQHDISDVAEPIAVREIAALRDSLAEAKRLEEKSVELIRVKGELLKKKAAEFEAILVNSPIGLALAHDPECHHVTYNEAMRVLIGALGADEKVRVLHEGKPLESERQPLLRAAAHGETISGMELEFWRDEDEQGPNFIMVNAVPLRDDDGQPSGAIGAAVDITERKLAERRLSAAEQELRESQRLVDLAQETGDVGFFQYMIRERCFRWTPGAVKLFGLETTENLQSLTSWARRIDDAEWRRMLRVVCRCVAAVQEVGTVDYRVHLPDGSSRWLSTRLRIIYEDRKPQYILGVSIDMTEQKNAEYERDAFIVSLQQARLEAEAANRSKDEFLAMLGHELRNPLSALSCSSDVLNQVDGNSDTAKTAREIIGRQTRHLAHMMDDLLDISRVIARRIDMPRYPLALHALVDRVINTLGVSGQLHQHEIVLDLQETWIEGNATRLEQIVNNLVINAVKYTPCGCRIDVRVAREGTDAVLEVGDNGPGIAPELLPRVFDLFVQGHRKLDRRDGGLGIGLTLVRQLVELHNGRVVASNRAPGTLVRITIPVIEPQGARVRPARRDETERPKRVVVVDDHADIVASLGELLRAEGHTVFTAQDGQRGLDLILELGPDVAIVDIGLPELDGYQIARMCRERGFRGKLIAFSGYGYNCDREKAVAAGFDAHFLKPVVSDQLLKAVAADY